MKDGCADDAGNGDSMKETGKPLVWGRIDLVGYPEHIDTIMSWGEWVPVDEAGTSA